MKKQAQFFALTEHVFSMLRKDKEQKIAKVQYLCGFSTFIGSDNPFQITFCNFLDISIALFWEIMSLFSMKFSIVG